MSAKTPDFDLREFVLSTLKPLLPKTWALSSTAVVDTPTRPTVELLLTSIERAPSAPLSNRLVTYTLNIIEPNSNPKTGEKAVDADVTALLNALDEVPTFAWTRAERGSWPAENPIMPAFTITLSILVQKAS